MEKIFTNLLSNAFKFTPEGGKVLVQISNSRFQDPRQLRITIADTGIGIPTEELPRVFDRFYQVDASQTREHEGSGIGLALTKELVELHHGSISVKSEAGKGTEFTVRFPLGREHLKDDEIVDRPEGSDVTFRQPEVVPVIPSDVAEKPEEKDASVKPIVLIVEDNADVRAYMREYLVTGYEVQEAHDGSEGIEKAKEIIPDLIISDVMMPKKDGYELCRTLKLDEKTSHIPIILLTAKAGTENKIEGLETGADDYLTKPFDAKELLVRVKNLIDLRQKLRERFGKLLISLSPDQAPVKSVDKTFLDKLRVAIEKNMSREDFTVEELAGEAAMSRAQLHRKLVALTGDSAGDLIRSFRLQRAKEMLENRGGTVAEIAYAVGFSSPAYFTKCFREQFGVVPSDLKNPREHA
jgi:DNA-binding response OmpR family regulator/anti-sigma regulatory factor (Ser/Thr protein kinase)